MESDRSIQSNVAPVWWDRERRTISFGGRPFVPALMFFDETAVSVVSAERVIFEVNTSGHCRELEGKVLLRFDYQPGHLSHLFRSS